MPCRSTSLHTELPHAIIHGLIVFDTEQRARLFLDAASFGQRTFEVMALDLGEDLIEVEVPSKRPMEDGAALGAAKWPALSQDCLLYTSDAADE